MDSQKGVLYELRLCPFPRLDIATGFDVAIYCGTVSFLVALSGLTHPRECESQRRSSLNGLAENFNDHDKTHQSS